MKPAGPAEAASRNGSRDSPCRGRPGRNGWKVWGPGLVAPGYGLLRTIGPALAALLVFCAAIADARAEKCAQPVQKDFVDAPASEFTALDEQLVALNTALDAARYDIRALLVLKDCRLVFERYKDGIGREHNHAVYSVTKSVSSTLVGALLLQGKLASVDAKITEIMPKPLGFSGDKWKKAERMTLKNVMQMSSGLEYQHNPAGHPIYDVREDRLAVALSPEFVAEPGSRFYYSDGDVSITGAVVASAADQNIYSYAKDVLFEPLKFSNHAWWFLDRTGRYPGGWGLRLRPMDMLKLGELYLQKGNWNGRPVFSETYVDLALAPGPSPYYGLHWWIGDASLSKGIPFFYANGFKGQRIYVFPNQDIVVALVSSLPLPEERLVAISVISAIADASVGQDGAPRSHTKAELAAIQRNGFNGETRAHQQNQDSPRRF